MTFIESANTINALSYFVNGIDAIDIERRLAIGTTNGRTSGKRKWIVTRLSGLKRDYEGPRIVFRAWDLDEALRLANTDMRLMKRIEAIVRQAH